MNHERRDAVWHAANASSVNGDSLPDIIADAIEAALSWWPAEFATAPADGISLVREHRRIAESVPTSGFVPTRWSCDCDATECILRRDQMQDAGYDPHAVVTFTCIGHGLVGKSHPGRVADGLLRLEAQAMLMLDRAHQEQCR